MTVKEFYQYMKENGAEDYEMGNWYYSGYGKDKKSDWEIDHKHKRVTTEYEC